MKKKIIIVSSSSATLLGGALAIPFLGNFKATSFKEQLIKKGFKPVTNWGNKASSIDSTILDKYGVYKVNKNGWYEFNLVKWCQEHEGKTENNTELIKKVEEICFETINSELRKINKRIIEERETDKWDKSWKAFKDKQISNNNKNWNLNLESESVPREFKGQCKENSRKPFIDKDKRLFEEVKEYCSTSLIPDPPK